MTNDVTVSSFIICLDVVHTSFEPQTFFDYLKSNHKKNVIFINAPDFIDSPGRSSRSSSDSKNSSGSHSRSASKSISRGISGKISSELNKLIEAKKKLIAQNEKKAQQLAKSGRPPSSTSHSKGNPDAPPPFEGQTEVIFIIQGFPYTNSQLKALSSYIDFGAFISIINQDTSTQNLTLTGCSTPKKQAEKTAKTPSGKKAQIKGCELDCAFNPGVVPPPRWNSLKNDADPRIAFCQIDAPTTLEECWNSLEHEIARIIRCKAEFDDHFKDHIFHILPSSSDSQKDFALFERFLKQHHDDFINALIAQIKDSEWKPSPPPPPPTQSNKYDQVFRQTNFTSLRFKVSKDPEPKIEPFFKETIPIDSFDVLYKLRKWKLDDEKAAINKAVFSFYTNYANFNAVAGHRYDSMLSQANKRLNLSLPLSFFEWTKYLYAYEHKDIRSTLVDISKHCYVFDTYLEESVGILWILAMPPVSRTIGQAIRKMYMPPVIDGISEWFTRIFEKDPPKPEGRGRNQLTPHQVLKSGADISILVPDIIKRTEDPQHNIYKLPLDYGINFDFASPYFFTNGMQVDIIRDIVNDKMIFGYLIHYPNNIEVSSYYNFVNIEFKNICRAVFEQNQSLVSTELHLDSDLEMQNTIPNVKSLTIYPIENIDQSIYFNNDQLAIRKNNQTYLISENGSLIFERSEEKIVLQPNGRIIKFSKDKKFYTEPDGSVYEITDDGPNKLALHHNALKDMRTGITKIIREDKISYTIYADGDRVIQFDDHFIIRQTQDSVVYEIPDVPYITFRDGSFTFFIQEICFALNSSKISILHVKGSTEINYDYNEIQLNNVESEASLTQGIFQMKYGDTILYADETGTQRMGPLIPADAPIKKKTEIVESKWGKVNLIKDTHLEADHLKLLSIFRPRFFAVRSDLSATEYIHKEGFHPDNKVEKSKTVDSLNIVTLHNKNEAPLVYFKQSILEKQPRAALLKTLQIPKQSRVKKLKKGQEPEDPQIIINEAHECNKQFLLFWKNILNLQNKTCQELENEYIEDITPKPLPPPEIIRVPVFTPPPRVLEMMSKKNSANVGSDNINYWESPEAEFAYPLKTPSVLPRPLSPRTQLFDMPDQKKDQKFDKIPEIPDYEDDLPTMTSMLNSSPKLKEAERIINLERNEISRMYQKSARINSEMKRTKDVTKPIPPSKDNDKAQNSPRRLSSRIYATEVSRPQTAHSTVEKKIHRKIDFGTVQIGKTVTATLDIQNTGNKPLHYSVSQPNHKDITMNTLPGKIMPGLKLFIKLTLTARTIGSIKTSFQFTSQLGEMTVPVFANVIGNYDLIEEEEPED